MGERSHDHRQLSREPSALAQLLAPVTPTSRTEVRLPNAPRARSSPRGSGVLPAAHRHVCSALSPSGPKASVSSADRL